MKVAILMPQVAPGAKPTIVIPSGQSLANKKAVLLASAMRLHQLAAQSRAGRGFHRETLRMIGYPSAQRNSVVLRLKLGWKIIGACSKTAADRLASVGDALPMSGLPGYL
jgi:hypothetical protein